MNYRSRQIRSMWQRDIAAKKQAWQAQEQNYKQDIINLQNSTDAKVIEQLEQDLTKQKDLLNQTIELLGKEEIKTLTDLQTLLEGKTRPSSSLFNFPSAVNNSRLNSLWREWFRRL